MNFLLFVSGQRLPMPEQLRKRVVTLRLFRAPNHSLTGMEHAYR
jgi:hypothetical protein